MTKALSNLSEIYTTLGDALRVSASYQDDSLSDVGLRDARERMAAAARADAAQALASVRSQIDSDKRAAEARFAAHVSGQTASTRDEWDRVRMILDSGRTLGEVIDTADVSRLKAILEWGPAYVESTVPAKMPLDSQKYADATRNSVLERWTAIDTSPALAGLFDIIKAEGSLNGITDRIDLLLAGRTPGPMDMMSVGYAEAGAPQYPTLAGIGGLATVETVNA